MAKNDGLQSVIIVGGAGLALFFLYKKGVFNSLIYQVARKNSNLGMSPSEDTGATYGPPMADGNMYDGGSDDDSDSMGDDAGGYTGIDPYGPPMANGDMSDGGSDYLDDQAYDAATAAVQMVRDAGGNPGGS